MKKSTKGALAAGAAAVLLMGGAGTLAYWTDSATANGGAVSSGKLDLSDITCDADWKEGSDVITKIVPGDTITKTCTGTLTLEGEHIGATVGLTGASVAQAEAAFNDEVDISADLTAPAAEITAPGSHAVTVTLKVAFPGDAATNASQTSTATLDDLQLEAVQTHDTN